MGRFTRLTNGFSKKVKNLAHAVALDFMHYNFVRIHQSLRFTRAMAAGVSSKLWSIEDCCPAGLSAISCPMTHYYKLAFTMFRIIGSLVSIYSLLSLGYVLITARPTVPSTVIATLLPAFFYLLLGILVFVFSKQLARLAVKGMDRE